LKSHSTVDRAAVVVGRDAQLSVLATHDLRNACERM
jgi:hypothetical protein